MLNLKLAGLVALMIMAVGVTAFALRLLPQGEGVYRDVPIPSGAESPQHRLPITQTVSGYTVDLYPFYAADNHIVITYTVTGPRGNRLPVYGLYQDAMHFYYQGDNTGSKGAPRLRDDLGRDAPWMESRFAWSSASGPEEEAPVSDFQAHQDKAACCIGYADVMWLDFVPPTNGEPPALRNLHLELPVFLPVEALTPVAEPKTGPLPVPTSATLNYVNDVAVARLTFDFPLPMDTERRVIEVNNSVEVAGVTVSLERVVVTPRDTLIALHYSDAPGKGTWLPSGIELTAGSWTSGVVTRQDGYFFVPPPYQQGEWVLTIPQLNWWDTAAEPFQQHTVDGPWVFKFTVPPPPPTTP
jgi:hypothetical protein